MVEFEDVGTNSKGSEPELEDADEDDKGPDEANQEEQLPDPDADNDENLHNIDESINWTQCGCCLSSGLGTHVM